MTVRKSDEREGKVKEVTLAVRPSDKTADLLDEQHIKMFVNPSVTEADARTVCPVFKMVCVCRTDSSRSSERHNLLR